MSKVNELFGVATHAARTLPQWEQLVAGQQCSFTGKKCYKIRKSQPDVAIGTCMVSHSEDPIMICPKRLLEANRIFIDCIHLLTLHEPGNELHVVSEIQIPGGSVDYFLASARNGKVVDFAGIELQTLDTTGTVWPERQRFLKSLGMAVDPKDVASDKPFGMNWKMTAKTILVQLHHKVETFEALNRRLVLVVQDRLVDYMSSEFNFGHLSNPPRLGDTLHMHGYHVDKGVENYQIQLGDRYSTDAAGVSLALELNASANVPLVDILKQLQAKVSPDTLLRLSMA